MVRRSIAALGIAMAALFLGLALSDISNTARESWTDSTSQAFTCSTGVATSCALTLSSAHAFPSTSGMSVVETSPASTDRTAQSTLSASKLVVTVSGLAVSTTYGFTVTYLAVSSTVSTPLSQVLGNQVYLLSAVLIILIGVAASAMFYPAWDRRRSRKATATG